MTTETPDDSPGVPDLRDVPLDVDQVSELEIVRMEYNRSLERIRHLEGINKDLAAQVNKLLQTNRTLQALCNRRAITIANQLEMIEDA